MRFTKIFSKIILSLTLMFAFCLPCLNSVKAATSYDVIFRAGAHGSFNGESKYVVEKEYGTAFPDDPYYENELAVDDGYIFTGWNKEMPETVTGKTVLVAKYTPLVDGVEYKIRYVDQNDVDIVTPRLAIGNVGSSVTVTAKTINDWPVDQSTKTIQLTEGTNEIKFVYTVPEDEVQTEYVTEYVTNTVDEVVTVPATAGTATTVGTGTGVGGAGAGTAGTTTGGDQAVAGETTDIEDNETPQAGADGETTIEDNETPQAGAKDSGSNNAIYIAGGAGAVILIAIVAYLLSKRKKAE